jgi:hypothetical protein
MHSTVHAIVRINTKSRKVNNSCDKVSRVFRRRRASSRSRLVNCLTKFRNLILKISLL